MDSTPCRAQRVLRRICLQLSFTPVLCCEGRGSLRFLPTVHGDVGGPGHTTLQATNTADMDSAPSLYHDYVSLHFYQVMKASTACRFAAKVLETGNVSLLTEASKLQARDADFGKNLQYSGEMDWKLGARLSTSSGPATRDSFNGDNSIQPKWLSGSLRQAYMFCGTVSC